MKRGKTKNPNNPTKPTNKIQSDESKQIKRINTNLTAIGKKYGFNSSQYKVATKHLMDHFDSSDIVYKNGKYSVRNTKKTQSNTYAITRSLSDESMSITNLKEGVKRRFKNNGFTKPTQSEIEEAIQSQSDFENVMNNTDEWYNIKSTDINKAMDILATKGRRKTDNEMLEVTRLVNKAIEEDKKKKEDQEKEREKRLKQRARGKSIILGGNK